jgi:hypothetical protein
LNEEQRRIRACASVCVSLARVVCRVLTEAFLLKP